MPPHCDSMDGPVVRAAVDALDHVDVDVVLPYVPADGEDEVRHAFDLALKARSFGGEARDVADQWFFETVVRVHRAGEGAAFAGLKPAGLDVGPVIPLAEAAIREGDPGPLAGFLADAVRRATQARFDAIMRTTPSAGATVEERRAHVQAVLGLQVWAHKLFQGLGHPAA